MSVGDSNIPLSIIHRLSRPKVDEETVEDNSTVDQVDLICFIQ
jgi:hypothetical protein